MSEKVTATFLPAKQRRCIEALVITGDVTQAAAAGNVARKTVYQWLKSADFREALKEAEADALDNLSRRLVSLADKAASVLETVLDDKKASNSQRLRASEIVLSNLLRMRELIDHEERLAAVERAAGIEKL